MTNPTWIEITGAVLFALAVLHTFSTKYFERLAHTQPAHAGIWHLLGEVEAVFGFWAFVLVAFMALAIGWGGAIAYLEAQHFTEPMFVFVIMVIAASRPVMQAASGAVSITARALPLPRGLAVYFLSLFLVPLLGSFITEPAAMTLAALMLRSSIFSRDISRPLQYATLGVLFVNVSIGGTLTNFAAPPVLMVAAKWEWSTWHMLSTMGWKSAIAVLINAAVVTYAFRREILAKAEPDAGREGRREVPFAFVAANLALLALVVVTNHHPAAFMGLFLLFLGLAEAYKRHHERLILREGLMVAFFLAGLVVLGGQQKWWLQQVLTQMNGAALYFGATALTAITDNAALTYLGSLVEGVSDEFKYALVAGAVTGGGLTVIANAPNPAGFAILKDSFEDQAISALGLLVAALPATLVAIGCLWGLREPLGGEWTSQPDRLVMVLLVPATVVAVLAWVKWRLAAAAR